MNEATSSVDTLTETFIQQAMQKLMRGRMPFAIAHRLSTIRCADCVLVIDGGRIHEQGTHAGLLRLRGRCYNLVTRQLRRQLEQEYDLTAILGAAAS